MSMKLVVDVLNLKLPLVSKVVLMKLADNANDKGVCWPSISNIAGICSISTRSVHNHIAKLIEMGLVHRQKRHAINGANRSNIYLITINKYKLSHGIKEEEIEIDPSELYALGSELDAPYPSERDVLPSEPLSLPLVNDVHPEPVNIEPVIEPNKNNINAREDENSDFYSAQTEKPVTKKSQHTRVGDIDLNFLNEILPTLIAKQAKKGKPLLSNELEFERFQFTADAVRDYIAHRQKIKKPVTPRALKLCLEQVLLALPSLPHTCADEALELAMRRGWQGIEAEWLINQMSTTSQDFIQKTYTPEGVLIHEKNQRNSSNLTPHQRKIAALNNLNDISWMR